VLKCPTQLSILGGGQNVVGFKFCVPYLTNSRLIRDRHPRSRFSRTGPSPLPFSICQGLTSSRTTMFSTTFYHLDCLCVSRAHQRRLDLAGRSSLPGKDGLLSRSLLFYQSLLSQFLLANHRRASRFGLKELYREACPGLLRLAPLFKRIKIQFPGYTIMNRD